MLILQFCCYHSFFFNQSSYCNLLFYCFSLVLLITGSHIVLISMFGRFRRFNKGHSSEFCEGSRVRQTPEEGLRTYRQKRYGNNNKEEDNSPETLNDKNSFFKVVNLVWFGLMAFNLIEGYLKANHLYTYILNICMICKHILLKTFLNGQLFAHSLFYLTHRTDRLTKAN